MACGHPHVYLPPPLGKGMRISPAAWERCTYPQPALTIRSPSCSLGTSTLCGPDFAACILPSVSETLFQPLPYMLSPSQPVEGAVGWGLWVPTSGGWCCYDLCCPPFSGTPLWGLVAAVFLLNIIRYFFFIYQNDYIILFSPFFSIKWSVLYELTFRCYTALKFL